MSETPNLAAALAKFQAEMPTVAKGKTANAGTYSYKYADLADVTAVAMPLLSKNGLSFICKPQVTDRGQVLTGVLLHESGEREEGSLIIAGSNRPQDVGSALTYARRYLFGCMTGIVTENDDDGAIAQQATKRAPRKKAERVKAAPPDDPWYDAPPASPEARQISAEQLAKMGAQMKDAGITDREKALLYVSDVVGRPIASRNDLSRAEASNVINALQADLEQPFPAGAPA